jgi:uncharacterized membrane protein YeaQ/YmgE (transglycosylase-associated protein family)
MTPEGFFTALLFGAVIGVLGRLALPGRQNVPIWLTIVVGVVAALLGSAIARALGIVDTPGIDWLEILIQVVLAAIGVALTAGLYSRRNITKV